MTWRVDVTVGETDDVGAELARAVKGHFEGARAIQRKNTEAIATMTKQPVEDVLKELQAFWALEDERVAAGVAAAVAMRKGHRGPSLRIRIEGHSNADGTGIVSAAVITAEARGTGRRAAPAGPPQAGVVTPGR